MRSLEAEVEASLTALPPTIIAENSAYIELEPIGEILFVVDLSETPGEDSFGNFENSLQFVKSHTRKVSEISYSRCVYYSVADAFCCPTEKKSLYSN